MMKLPQYAVETALYPLTPEKYRWVYNKLMVAEKCGVECGPAGVVPPHKGPWCYKPVMNLHGCGKGGWFKKAGHWYKAGYFWMPWYDGYHCWTEYVNDIPVRQAGGVLKGDRLVLEQSYDFVPLPEPLRGISKYSLLESIDGNLIAYAPRNVESWQDGYQDLLLARGRDGDIIWHDIHESTQSWL